MSDVIQLVSSGKPALFELQDELNKLFKDPRFDRLTVSECIGLLEMFKWEWIQSLEPRDE